MVCYTKIVDIRYTAVDNELSKTTTISSQTRFSLTFILCDMNVRHVTLSEEEHAALLHGNGKPVNGIPSELALQHDSTQRSGLRATEIAALEGVSRQTVAHWLNRYEAGGIAALHTVKGQGRHPIVRHDNQPVIDKIEKLVERYPQKIDQALAEIETLQRAVHPCP